MTLSSRTVWKVLHLHRPLVLLTEDGTTDNEYQIDASGVNEVIAKGVVPRRIVGALKRLLKAPGLPKGRELQLTNEEWRTIS